MTEPEQPFVPASSTLPELTIKALIFGILMAVILSVANAYLGLKAGMTISAVFPAAVVAMAVFRLPFMKGNILQENLARTTASVGEALVAGAIFTIPAFLMVQIDGKPLWSDFHYWEATILVLAGGLLGTLFVILLRRTLAVDMNLPYPEGYACYEMVKASQKGAGAGAKQLFAAIGVGALIKFILDSKGIALMKESVEFVLHFPKAVVQHIGDTKIALGGGSGLGTPAASPALMGVGFIIGPKYSAINFSGGILAWLVLVPLILFLDPDFPFRVGMTPADADWSALSGSVWRSVVRPIAVGAMLASSLYTVYGMRKSIVKGFNALFGKRGGRKGKTDIVVTRIEQDLAPKWINLLAVVSFALVLAVYYYFTQSFWGALVASIIMIITAFLFSAVGGYLVGIVGNSNQPVSGLTLSGLIVAALVMVMIGVKGAAGVAAVLGVATVVCCAACMAGDMIQDLKVGHLLGGTPWKMEVAELISVLLTSFVIVLPIMMLHQGYASTGGIGGTDLPAPQAGLMAMMSKGIIGGEMPWMLIIVGILFAFFLFTINAPSPMLIAVGMYLPFETTSAIFIGGIFRWIVDRALEKRKATEEKKRSALNMGTLIASGFIAGEALMGVLLSAPPALRSLNVSGFSNFESVTQWIFGVAQFSFVEAWGGWLSLILFAVIGYALMALPLKKAKTG